jgi:alkylhydroperoxidase/carboxymuconolactone decarboxylase family protein YurZ
MTELAADVMARFLGPENVDRGREYLEALEMLATLGQQLQLGVYVRAARRQGASEEEIREVLRQVAVYAGFPSAWNALATMKQTLEGSSDNDTEGRAGS